MGIVKFWTKALDFTGRSSRGEFWLGYLVNVTAVLFLIAGELFYRWMEWYRFLKPIELVIMLWMFLGVISSKARRLNDAGKSPWFVLLALVPFGKIVLLVFLLMPTAE